MSCRHRTPPGGRRCQRISAALALLTMVQLAAAQARELCGTCTVLVENDVFTGTDRHYTNGLQLSYLSGEDAVPRFIRRFAELMPYVADNAVLRAGYVLGHNIYTPNDTASTVPPSGERPYAGYLYGGFAVVAESPKILDTWELDLGVVGPSAQGEFVQNEFHRLIGAPQARGWAYQLQDEPTINLTHERKWRELWSFPALGVEVDVTPHLAAALGNVTSYLGTGLTARVGSGLKRDFGTPRIRPSLPGSAFFLRKDRIDGYLFAGADGRTVLNNLFLDGNTFRDSPGVGSKTWVGDLQVGLVVLFPQARLTYSYVYRSQEYSGQDKADRFGALSLSARF